MRIFAINPLQDTYINAKNNTILINMSFIHNVNIVGGRNADPAILKTRLEPMKLEDNMGISAKFIAFGEIANITGSDCQFQFLDSLQSRNSSYCHLLRHLMTKTSLWLLLF